MGKISFCFLITLEISVFQSNAQTQFAVADFEEISENIEQHIVANHTVIIETQSLFESIKAQCIPFIQKEFQWAQRRIEGGCLSSREIQLTENYLIYLRDEMLGIEVYFEELDSIRINNSAIYVNDLVQKLIEERVRMDDLNIVLENAQLLYHDEKIDDITEEIIAEILKVDDQKHLDNYFIELNPLMRKIETRKNDLLVMTYANYKAENPLDDSIDLKSLKETNSTN